MLLPLDHLPFPGPDLDASAAAFAALGFTVAPACSYTSPEYPEARWTNRSVFMRRGWFDLLHAEGAPPDTPVLPRAALFLTDDLQAAERSLEEMRRRPAYGLTRRWDDAPERGVEEFRLFEIRERISPLGLAVIEHHYPCPDTLPAWFDHPNTAVELAGLIFKGGAPGPFAENAGSVLDLSGFQYADDFERQFGDAPAIAVSVGVERLASARAVLDRAQIAYRELPEGLCALAQAPLACGFRFFETRGDR